MPGARCETRLTRTFLAPLVMTLAVQKSWKQSSAQNKRSELAALTNFSYASGVLLESILRQNPLAEWVLHSQHPQRTHVERGDLEVADALNLWRLPGQRQLGYRLAVRALGLRV